MTSSHKSVRIIERKQREIPVANKTVPLEKTAEQIEREMVRTVKSWIDGRRKVREKFAAAGSANGLLILGSNPVIVGR
ncbi:MAG TPA: hypothetical protein VIF64_15960 [Pyrinomonadaceae bacterium]